MPFFKSTKSPADVVKSLREALAALERSDQGGKKAASKVRNGRDTTCC